MNRKKFKSLTKAQQRVAIAKDVIRQIHVGRIKAKYMVYLQNLNGGFRTKPGKSCHACALGALFVSKYKLDNGMWISDPDQDELRDSLSPYFSIDQLAKIENAFEGWWCQLSHPEDRLIAIMQNIVDGKGIFNPNILYEVVYE